MIKLKKVLEFDVEKDGGIILLFLFVLFNKDHSFKTLIFLGINAIYFLDVFQQYNYIHKYIFTDLTNLAVFLNMTTLIPDILP